MISNTIILKNTYQKHLTFFFQIISPSFKCCYKIQNQSRNRGISDILKTISKGNDQYEIIEFINFHESV